MTRENVNQSVQDQIVSWRIEELNRQLGEVDDQIGRKESPEQAESLWRIRADILGRIEAAKKEAS